ncbi:SDR family NAD(P)-dependent oxidoreductase [Trujillonella endophytica]|uniref:NAD(P)-dependent dehydrogenase, short-chain alcohol dehydrogenase family n=1 Tax=Trujillonella endophytica TaxID=673521 RepID=A0A1H8WG25_9ACTN|nr:SDR family oxidoreductase [Trujillella endophytica]SEP26581.1 NAD(P)-dependent dehydrogenase, short-chain alcohol dehydrogenase family [Trujillella endophytica]
MRRLEGKGVLVAGGGGIGGALAARFASEGAGVVLGDLDLAAAQVVVDRIVADGGRAVAVHLDGADEDSIASAVATTVSAYGGLDGLHVNFASFVDSADGVGVVDLPLEVFDEAVRVNQRGHLLCTKLALPPMIERGGGSIVYTSSAAAYLGETTRLPYAMSKAAGLALMRHVASRYGRNGVRANAIAPGLIVHPRALAELPPEFVQNAVKRTWIKSRLGAPEDVAATAAHLMSDDGAYITGQVISVDGGATRRA